MGRKKGETPTTNLHITLPTDLVGKLELLLANPMTGMVQYGARNKLIASLLYEWLNKQGLRLTPATEPDKLIEIALLGQVATNSDTTK